MMQPEILFALIAAVGFGIGDMWSAIPARRMDAKQVVFFELVILFIFYLLIHIFWIKDVPELSWQILLAGLLGGLGLVVAITALFRSLAVGKVGVVAPIFNADALIAVLLGFVLFGEVLSAQSYVGIFVVLSGIFLLSANIQQWKKVTYTEPGLVAALVSMSAFGITLASYKYVSDLLSPLQTITLVNAFALLWMILLNKNIRSYIQPGNFELKTLFHIFGISILVVISVFSLVYAFSISTLSVPAVIAGTSPLVSAVLAKLFFKERLGITQYIGMLLAVAGIMLLSV